MKIPSLTAMVGLALALAAAPPAPSVAAQDDNNGHAQARIERDHGPATVLQRAKLGTYIEDIDFIPNGPFANHIVMTAGYEVYGVPANANSDRAVRKLFDLRRLGIGTAPRGIAYIASERLFAVVDPGQPTMLFICDKKGKPLPARTIQYLGGYLPFVIEGLAYLPPTSPLFPDHLVMVTTADFNFLDFRLEVMRRDGQVVAEIPIPDVIVESANSQVSTVAFAAPDHLLVGAAGEMWTLDFAGSIVSGPVVTGTATFPTEGLVQIRDGRIVATDGAQLRFYDAGLNRLPQDDRDAGTGVHLILPFFLSWNSDISQHLIVALTEKSGEDFFTQQMATLPTSLDSATRLLDFADPNTIFRVRGSEDLPDEDLIAVTLRRRGSSRPPEIVLYDSAGALVERINIAAVGSPQHGFAFIPSTREFAVSVSAEPSKLKILTRAGALAREIDFSPIGISVVSSVEYFNSSHPSGGQFLIFTSPFFGDGTRAIITDFNGNLMSELNYRDALGLLTVSDVSAITTGRQAGAFSAVDSQGSEIVVFRLGSSWDDN